jgi:hypothetical protein
MGKKVFTSPIIVTTAQIRRRVDVNGKKGVYVIHHLSRHLAPESRPASYSPISSKIGSPISRRCRRLCVVAKKYKNLSTLKDMLPRQDRTSWTVQTLKRPWDCQRI